MDSKPVKMCHVGPEPVVTPDESAHKINSIKLRELDTNGIVWSTTPSRIARNIGIACTVKYPTWLGKDELDTYIIEKMARHLRSSIDYVEYDRIRVSRQSSMVG